MFDARKLLVALAVCGFAGQAGVFVAPSLAAPAGSAPSRSSPVLSTSTRLAGEQLVLPSATLTEGLPTANPYVEAARKTGVPLDLLVAVAGAESGWHPWALNIRGQAYYCNSREEAMMLLAGARDADVGLMQINFSFWGSRLGYSKEQLLDPGTNLIIGGRILKMAMDRRGDFWGRTGSYHSLNPDEKIKWTKTVYAYYWKYLNGIPINQDAHSKIP